MAIVIKEIKVVTTVERNDKQVALSPQWISEVNKLLNERKQRPGRPQQLHER